MSLEIEAEQELIFSRLARTLRSPGCPVSGLVAPGRIELHVHSNEQHLWSPQLVIDVEEKEGHLQLHGRFGPHPSVWTMYVAGYVSCAFLSLVGCSFAYAQYVMEQPPWALLALPLAAFGALGLYLVSLLGQGLSQTQMDQLKDFLNDELDRVRASNEERESTNEAPQAAALFRAN